MYKVNKNNGSYLGKMKYKHKKIQNVKKYYVNLTE